MDCHYQVVESDLRIKDRNEWITFLRQVHISSGVWMMFYMAGLCTGAPTVFIPQLREDGIDPIDDEMASWLNSVSNITAIPWVLILPSLTQYAGRRPVYILTSLLTLSVHIILYFSTTPYEILVAGVIHGFACASNVIVMSLILVEYSTLKYRSTFFNITSVSYYGGIWSSNVIGTYFYWKNIAVLGIICSAYTFTQVFYPESPIWLVSKGKYKRAELAFKWLHGDNENSRKELQDVIKSRAGFQNNLNNEQNLSLYATFLKKEFYKPLLLCLLISAQYNFSGKHVCSVYAIEVLGKVTGNKETAHLWMLILDGVTILGMCSGILISKLLKRRTLYYSTAFTGVFFLLMISLHLYLVRTSILSESNILTILLLVAYSFSISCGPLIIGYAMYNEVILLKYQKITYTISSLCLFGTISAMINLAPVIIKYLSVDGMFLFNGITFGAFTLVLYFFLPDTEGKTLLEIEQLFKDTVNESFNTKQSRLIKKA